MLYERPEEMMKYLLARHETYSKPQSGIAGQDVRVKGVPTKAAEAARAMHTFCRQQIQIDIEQKDEFHTACHWYILNKISYSGMAMIGSYAPLAWDQNFTINCIKNLPKTTELMRSVKDVRITNEDYSVLLQPDGDHDDNTFVFLDPPYKIPHNLYGKDGDMHEGFDHKKFVDAVKQCPAQWLITYNEDPDLQKWFEGYSQLTWELQYTMKAAKREGQDGSAKTGKSGKKGRELLIASYPLTSSSNPSTPCELPSSNHQDPSC